MNEITIQKFNFIPECLTSFFTKDVLDAYFETEENRIPCLTTITWDISDPIIIQTAGYMKTDGQDIDYYTSMIEKMHGEEQSTAFYKIIDKNFGKATDDVLALMHRLNLSYCYLDDEKYIRSHLRHYGAEVW